MTVKKKQITRGVILRPDDVALEGISGELKVSQTGQKLQAYLDSAQREVLTADQAQALSNKTIDVDNNTLSNVEVDNLKAGVLNTSGTLTGASNLQVPSALAVKTYADAVATTAQTNLDNHINDAIDAHDASAISNVPAGTISATDVQAAINELDGDIQGHITDAVDAHDASAISVVPTGNLASTEVQAALVELQTDIDTNATNLSNHLADAVDAHDAFAISVVPTGNLSSTEVQAALVELQGDIDGLAGKGDVFGPASSVDNAVARFDGTTGKLIQNSSVTISDTGEISNNARIIVGDAAAESVISRLRWQGITAENADSASNTGSNVTLPTAGQPIRILTGVGLNSIDMIPSAATYQVLTLVNQTGGDVTINNDTGATAADRIITGTGAALVLKNNSAITLRYIPGATPRWYVIGGTGGAATAGAADVNALLIQTFDSATLGNFTQTGLDLSTVNPINGAVSAALTHQAAINQSFKQTISVDRKFRSQQMVLSTSVRSTATSGNLTLNVFDETNSANIIASEQIQTSSVSFTANTSSGSAILSSISNESMLQLAIGEAVSGSGIPTGAVIIALGTNQVTLSANATATASGVSLRASSLPTRRSFSFIIPASCASLSYTITALPEANSPRSVVDDVVIELSSTSLLQTSVEVPNVTAWQSYTPSFQGFGTPTNVEFQWRQAGQNVEIRGKFTAGTTTAVEARVGLPGGYTSAGTSLIPSIQMIGTHTNNNSTDNSKGGWILGEPSVSYVTFASSSIFGSSVQSPLTKQNGTIYASGNIISLTFSIPVSGLSATSTKTIALTQSGLVQNSDSSVRLDTANGYGSTATKIRRFSAIRENFGSDILYQDSAVNGATFTVQTSGIYSISYTDNFTSAAAMGITKNASNTTTDIQLVPAAERLAMEVSDTVGRSINVAWTGYLAAGDVIRAQTQAVAATTNELVGFTISKESSLKQVSVSSDQKITIPTSELRMEGSSTRGATATAIVRFDNTARVKGDAFTIESDATLGTRITMRKSGRLNISATLVLTNGRFVISRNQQTLTALPTLSSESISSAEAAGTLPISASNTIDVASGDIIRISANVTPSANIVNNLQLSFQEQDVAVSVTNTLPQFSEADSSVRVDTANGYGSTATRIRRFSNIRDNIGTDIEYVASTTNGDSFVIKSAGVYNISYSEVFTGGSTFGISKNSNQLTTDFAGINVADQLAISSTSASGFRETVSWQGYLAKDDVIRAHTAAVAAATNSDVKFTISKVGKPNVTGVNVTPFVNIPQKDSQTTRIEQITSGMLSTSTVRFNLSTASISTNRNDIVSIIDDASIGTRFVALKRCDVSIAIRMSQNVTGGELQIRKNNSTTPVYYRGETHYNSVAGYPRATNVTMTLEAGEYFNINSSSTVSNSEQTQLIFTATANSDSIITASESFSTDTALLQYASSTQYTLATLNTAPVGTFITFTYAANTNTRTQTTTAPTQSTSDMNTNGIQMRVRSGDSAGGGAALPSVVAIQIGKGLKGVTTDLYKNTGKAIQGTMEYVARSATSESGFSIVSYNESTGILYLDAGFYQTTSISNNKFLVFSDITNYGNDISGYVVINASKSPALVGVPQVLPRIATLSDVKASGTAGGTFTSGAFQTRTLNTLSDPQNIGVTLASNQFTLLPGSYYFDIEVPAYAVNRHVARLRNITAGADALLGIGAYAAAASGNMNNSSIRGTVTITTTTTFEVQNRCETTGTTTGFGLAMNFGVNEVYTVVKIQKIQ